MVQNRAPMWALSARRVSAATVCLAAQPGEVDVDHVYEDPSLDHLDPQLDWIRQEGLRLGYNYRTPLEWYPQAAALGINGIISRLEIANAPSGDELLGEQYPEGTQAPAALIDWRMVTLSSLAARKHGIRFFYMLGLASYQHNVVDGFRDNPRRHDNGKKFSPMDDIYWKRVVENRFLRVAERLQGRDYQIDGFLIDSETYRFGGGHPGGIDYGDFALSEFVAATGTELKFGGLSIDQRRDLVAKLGLNDALYQFEFERVRQMAENTRKRVQDRIPGAILGFFLWRDNLWFRAVAAGFSTPEVPCWVGLEGGTYPGRFDQGLLMHMGRIREQAGVPLLLSAGTALPGSDRPRYMGALESAAAGNLYHRAINSAGGYWFWALSRIGERQPFLNMLQLVNRELDRYCASGRTYRSHLRACPFPVEQPPNLAGLQEVSQWLPVPAGALPAEPPVSWGFACRSSDLALAIPAQAEQELSFVVRTHRLAQYPAPTHVTFFPPGGQSVVDRESIPISDKGWSSNAETVTQTAHTGGVWVLAVSGGPPVVPNAFSVLPQTQSAVVVPADGALNMFGFSGSDPFETNIFFYVPRRRRTFDIRLSGRAVLRLFDATGRAILEHREGRTQRLDRDDEQEGPARAPDSPETATIRVAADQAGRVWWVQITEAGWGSYGIALEGIPAVYAARPGQLLVPEL